MTWQGGLGLPEREYYLQADAKMVETRAYVAHIEKMLQLIGLQMQLKVLLKLWLWKPYWQPTT
jgi:predicted metalloendopeptidase